MRLVCVTIFLAYSLSACGHKGPLFLPKTEEENRMVPSKIERK